MSLRIGIVTWCGVRNFGTGLQAYALQKVLQDAGHDVVILKRKKMLLGKGVKASFLRGLARLGLLDLVLWLKRLFSRKTALQRKREKWLSDHDRIVDVSTPRRLRLCCSRLDCIISGSDQIWNTYHHFDPFHFLDFAKGIKRISYASSIGTSDVNPIHADEVRALLEGFDRISTREAVARDALARLTGRPDVVQVLDPTLLITGDEWRRVAADAKLDLEVPKRFLLCYLLSSDPKYVEQIAVVKDRLGVDNVVILPSHENPRFRLDGALTCRLATPSEFIALLDRAACVVTDSFHCTAFCVNLSRPFVEFKRFRDDDRSSQNSRIYDLLGRYGLGSRFYDETSFGWCEPVDFKAADAILAKERRASRDYLFGAIGGNTPCRK